MSIISSKKFRVVGKVVFAVLCVHTIIIMALLCLYAKTMLFSEKGPIESEMSENEFYHLLFDPETQVSQITKNSISSSTEGVDDFISYEDSDGLLNLFYNKNLNGYVCSGHCYCENDDDEFRRVASSVVKKSITYLVASISAFSAMQLARNHFDEKCVEKMKDECPRDYVMSTLDECEQKEMQVLYDKFGEIEDIQEEFTAESMRGRYICQGKCILNPDFIRDIEVFREESGSTLHVKDQTKVCERIINGEFHKFPFGEESNMQQWKKLKVKTSNDYATLRFAITSLDPYCRSVTQLKKLPKRAPEGQEKIFEEFLAKYEDTEMCSGFMVSQTEGMKWHRGTRCKKVDHLMDGPNK